MLYALFLISITLFLKIKKNNGKQLKWLKFNLLCFLLLIIKMIKKIYITLQLDLSVDSSSFIVMQLNKGIYRFLTC